MALKTVVKVGGITNLSDARYCAGMGVDFLGFKVIQEQAGSISAKSYQEIRGWITGPQIVAEVFGLQDVNLLDEIVDSFAPDFFELSLEELSKVRGSIPLPFILHLKEGESMPEMEYKPSYIVTSGNRSDLGKLIPEWEILATVTNPAELENALRQTGISGVSLNGSDEIKPGLKNFEDLALILEALEEE